MTDVDKLAYLRETIRKEEEKEHKWQNLLAAVNDTTLAEVMGWATESEDDEVKEEDSSDGSEVSFGWDKEDEEEVEPLPSSVYSSPPRAPTPPIDLNDFTWSQEGFTSCSELASEPEYLPVSPLARRSSPTFGGEHNVIEQPFLTAEWGMINFPIADELFGVPSQDWLEDTTVPMDCYTGQAWMRWVMKKPLL